MNDTTLANIEGAEISWFAPLCNGDDDFLGDRNPLYKSSWENTSAIVKTADQLGFKNVLCPSSYQVGQDPLAFVAGMASITEKINFLVAIRCGELHPPMLARTIASLDHMLKGRLTINIISSNLPGMDLSSKERYARSREVIQILKQSWTQDQIKFKGNY
ncbi:MAG: LLM class flavin-dependent oxidoreductase, partial [Flavobacteriaceae bacterium]|nr:LLM class flavin-dependent oxidoreductase [Flavobacteriaceae bacterium]